MVTAGLLAPVCCAHRHVFRASAYLSGGTLSTEPVEEYSEDDYTWAELDAFILALSNPW